MFDEAFASLFAHCFQLLMLLLFENGFRLTEMVKYTQTWIVRHLLCSLCISLVLLAVSRQRERGKRERKGGREGERERERERKRERVRERKRE